jgi:hypothetical protein
MSSNVSTFRLFRQKPSFLGGMSAILDFSSIESRYNQNKSGAEADTKALENDWKVIGFDMNNAIETYAKSTRA